jgi:hypothetical protein
MTIPTTEELRAKAERTALHHRWQEFRERCLTLAIKSGATGDAVIPAADKFGDYILTRSEREMKADPAPEEEEE